MLWHSLIPSQKTNINILCQPPCRHNSYLSIITLSILNSEWSVQNNNMSVSRAHLFFLTTTSKWLCEKSELKITRGSILWVKNDNIIRPKEIPCSHNNKYWCIISKKTFLLFTYQALVHGFWADLEKEFIMNTNDCIHVYVANTHREANRLNSEILFIRIPRKQI